MNLHAANELDPQQRRQQMVRAFQERFGQPPQLGARAPGRVDLMGSHTDYNAGHVLTLPIDRDTWIMAAPVANDTVTVHSLNLDPLCQFTASSPEAASVADWGRYVQGVAIALEETGYAVGGVNALVHGTVPVGSGLSSSASLESAVATLFEQMGGYSIPLVEKAKLCQQAENRWVGVQCGILDQYSCILGEQGKALLLDCRNLTHTYADLPSSLSVVICNTCAPRQLSGSEYGERRAQCEQAAAYFATTEHTVSTLRDVSLALFEEHQDQLPELVAKRARFIIEEHARVTALARALQQGNNSEIDRITAASFAGARDLFEISVPAMQAMFDAMRSAPGHVGSRQAGAGFGGCMVAFVDREHVSDFATSVVDSYQQARGMTPHVYPVDSAPGAGKLEL